MGILMLLPFVILRLGNSASVFPWSEYDRRTELSDMDYGQNPPGKTPVLFSPGFLRTQHRIHSSPTFSRELKEVYWSVLPRNSDLGYRKETILFSKKREGIWSKPEVASFSGEYADGGPLFSNDGNRLYFYSRRPISKQATAETKGEIWFVERQDEGWGEPTHLRLDFEGEKLFFSISSNNNVYFTSGHGSQGRGTGLVDIYCARSIGGVYSPPVKLPNEINSSKFIESDPLISSDEKFLIFYSLERPDSFGQYDLYICYSTGNNKWAKPQNLGGQINTGYSRFPRFSPEGRYLFFVRSDGIYWVDSSVVYDVGEMK